MNMKWRKKYSVTVLVLGVLLFLIVFAVIALIRGSGDIPSISHVIDKLLDTTLSLVIAFYGIDVIDKLGLGNIIKHIKSDSDDTEARIDE